MDDPGQIVPKYGQDSVAGKIKVNLPLFSKAFIFSKTQFVLIVLFQYLLLHRKPKICKKKKLKNMKIGLKLMKIGCPPDVEQW